MEKVVKSKGDRLNWAPLKDVKPVVLQESKVVGRKVSKGTLESRKRIGYYSQLGKSGYLVP